MTINEPRPAGAQRTDDAVLQDVESDLRAGNLERGEQLPGNRRRMQ